MWRLFFQTVTTERQLGAALRNPTASMTERYPSSYTGDPVDLVIVYHAICRVLAQTPRVRRNHQPRIPPRVSLITVNHLGYT